MKRDKIVSFYFEKKNSLVRLLDLIVSKTTQLILICLQSISIIQLKSQGALLRFALFSSFIQLWFSFVLTVLWWPSCQRLNVCSRKWTLRSSKLRTWDDSLFCCKSKTISKSSRNFSTRWKDLQYECSETARHAEAMREAMFDVNFFRQCCSYGEKQGNNKKEFNFATPGHLNTLMTHPFEKEAKIVWQKLFRCVNDKRTIARDVGKEDCDKSEAKGSNAKCEKMEIDDFFGPVQAKAERGVCGFRNIKYSCYMNALLQCLAHLEPMRRALMEDFDANKLNL